MTSTSPNRRRARAPYLAPLLQRAATGTDRSVRRWFALACLVGTLLGSRPVHALDAPVVVEIGEGADALLDPRATRRLIALELADVELPAQIPSKRPRSSLFFRVVQVGRDLRVELWERGEFHGARVVAGTRAEGQLGARRVALAAAELARRLQKKRQIQAERERVDDAARRAAALRAAHLTLDGPLAIRPSLEVADIGSMAARLVGPRLLGQWSFARRARLDGGFAWLAGGAPEASRVEWLELSLAPSERIPLGERFDLDLGVDVAAAWLRFGHVRGVDSIVDQSETWSARAAAAVRIEPRLARNLRLSIGALAGLVLREVPFEPLGGGTDRLRGMWLSFDLGLVLTPR